ncbi:MAG TPA: signal recognition particle protein, partial [Bacteroidetes bacterium]|nr:signal recognition particle protein [Bacteroidota bacterium]
AVLKSITPGQQIVKIIYDELTRLMGQSTASLRFANIPPTIFMATGLQGSGKTTFVGKLALYLRGQKHSPLMVAADIYRPAAIDQLKTIGKQLNIPVFSEDGKNPIQICWDSIQQARQNGNDVVIFDTAGRLHIDENMMKELSEIKEKTKPHNIFFVADGMTGQDAVKAATEFNNWLAYDGVVLTKMDGDARGGAALSIKAVTGKPIMFVGMGEKFNTLEQFHPDRMASRILGMGDVISLVEKAQIAVSEEESRRMEEAIRKKRLTFDDFLQQLRQIKKMGPLEQIIGMIPGLGASPLGKANVDEKALVKVEAIIQSMTREERRNPRLLNGNRKRRIARGSGTTVQDVNRLISQFNQMQKLMKRFSKGGKRSMRGVLGGNYPF